MASLLFIVVALLWEDGENSTHGYSYYEDETIQWSLEHASAATIFSPKVEKLEGTGLILLGFYGTLEVGWSLGVEFFFYLLTPLLFFANKRWRHALVAITLLSIGYFIYAWMVVPDVEVADIFIYKNALTALPFYLCGCLCARYREYLPSYSNPKAIFLFLGLLYLFHYFILNPYVLGSKSTGTYIMALFIAIPLGLFAVITEDLDKSTPLSRTLGNLSYGVYVFHMLVATVLVKTTVSIARSDLNLPPGDTFGRIDDFTMGIHTLIISTLVALLFHKYMEEPMQKWRKRIRKSESAGFVVEKGANSGQKESV